MKINIQQVEQALYLFLFFNYFFLLYENIKILTKNIKYQKIL